MLDRKKENNTVCSSINLPSNLVGNVFASVHYLDFNIKLLFFFTHNFRSFPDFVSKSSEHCWRDFFTRCWEPKEEWFWRFENFSKLKQHFVNTEHQLKSKLAWSVFQRSMQWRSSVHITCIKSGHLTSARFEHFVCHRYIWYIFSLLFSVCNTIDLSHHEHV